MTELASLIQDKIKNSGEITFRDFMEQALYHPRYGYYTAFQDRLGRQGDFYTSVHVSYLFGAMIARQLDEMCRLMDCAHQFVVTEFGAGDGMLAKDILHWMSEHHRECFEKLSYRIVEISPVLSQRQQDTLNEYSAKVTWLSQQELAEQEPVDGVVVSNELIDAFPVHMVKNTTSGWQEAWITLGEQGQLEQSWGSPSRQFDNYFSLLDWQPQREGHIVEVNEDAMDWLTDVASGLRKGFVITVDYGYRAMELDDPRRAHGTVLCYHRHKVIKDPLINVGQQDITSHANFTALMNKGAELGLATTALMPQSKFLLNLGIMHAVEDIAKSDAEAAQQQALAVNRLAFPGGAMGETFRVLVQHKGMVDPQLHCLIPFHKQLR